MSQYYNSTWATISSTISGQKKKKNRKRKIFKSIMLHDHRKMFETSSNESNGIINRQSEKEVNENVLGINKREHQHLSYIWKH